MEKDFKKILFNYLSYKLNFGLMLVMIKLKIINSYLNLFQKSQINLIKFNKMPKKT